MGQVAWADFLLLPPRPEGGKRHELHDGEVISAPPARPIHIKVQKRIEQLLETLAGERGVVTLEFPYRPLPDLQYWIADIAFIPRADWDGLPPDSYPVYAPALIVEVLSPSNTLAKVDRQRVVALSAGTLEFWVVGPETRTVQISDSSTSRKYTANDTVPVAMFGSATLRVDQLFEV